ncbi:MAG: hypothetical protein ACE5GM_07160 [bacterium]
MAATDKLREIPNVCNPRTPLPADDPDKYYVDCWEVRGGGGLKRIERKIRGSESFTYQLVSGHTGCGKTTEILRLQAELEDNKEGRKYKVLYVDADKKLDLSNVEFVDILLAIGEQLESEKPGNLLSGLSGMQDELGMALDGAHFSFNLGVMSIKSGGSQRKGLRKAFGNYLTPIISRLNDALGDLRKSVKEEGYTDLVMIVDNLEKILPLSADSSGGFEKTNHEAIFVDRASLFTDLNLHLVLTVPLSLCHISACASQLGRLYDREPTVIPMIRVWDRIEKKDYDDGINILKKVIAQRMDLEKVFDDEETWKKICRKSGGAIRDFLRIVSEASLYCDNLPITGQTVDKAVQEMVNAYNRGIGPYMTLLKKVDRTKQFPDEVDIRQKKIALHVLYVLEYYNGDQWYDIHPLIRRTRTFKESKHE